jgi:hypothetical protein
MKNQCEGCYSFIMIKEKNDEDVCTYNTENLGDCPCSNCLIKCMCSDGCEEYCSWTKLIEGENNT